MYLDTITKLLEISNYRAVVPLGAPDAGTREYLLEICSQQRRHYC